MLSSRDVDILHQLFSIAFEQLIKKELMQRDDKRSQPLIPLNNVVVQEATPKKRWNGKMSQPIKVE